MLTGIGFGVAFVYVVPIALLFDWYVPLIPCNCNAATSACSVSISLFAAAKFARTLAVVAAPSTGLDASIADVILLSPVVLNVEIICARSYCGRTY